MKRKSLIILLNKFYKGLMTEDESLYLIKAYCKQYGSDKHKENIEEFIKILTYNPILKAYCLSHVVAEYEIEFSVVKIYAAADPNSMPETLGKIITVY